MRKILWFLIIIGISLGLFLGLRAYIVNITTEDNEEIQESEEIYSEELNIPLIEVDNLNPLLTNNRQVADILKLIYEPLIDINSKNEFVPSIAIEWMEKDDLNWIIKLRDNVSWHDDKKLKPIDVVFTIKTIMSPEITSVYKVNVNNIENVYELDENTINITLKQRDINFPSKLTFPIIPEYYFKNYGMSSQDKANRPMGTGPYKYVSTNDNRIKIIANNDWWKDEEFILKTIYLYKYNSYGEAIKAFKASEIDVITTTMNTWDKKFGTIGINNYKYHSTEFETLIPNTSVTILKDSSVRRAILCAINREKIISDIYNNNAVVHDIPIHNYSWIYKEEQAEGYSLDKAKQLLLNAGWQQKNSNWNKIIDGKNYTLKFNIMVYKENEEKVLVAELIRDELANIGITVTINKVSWNTYIDNLSKGKFDLALASIDVYTDLDIIELLEPVNNINYAKYNNGEMSNIISTIYLSNMDLENNFKLLQDKYKSEAPYIGLYFKTNVLLTNKAVKGQINPTIWNPYMFIWTWHK